MSFRNSRLVTKRSLLQAGRAVSVLIVAAIALVAFGAYAQDAAVGSSAAAPQDRGAAPTGGRAGHTSIGPWVDRLARDVERAEGIRAVKRLQYMYAQYSQFGMWNEMADLFADGGELINGSDEVKGRTAIVQYFLTTFGGGHEGLEPGVLHTQMTSEPVVNLSSDGRSAKGRWHELSMTGRFGGAANWAGSIQENDYVKENGVWKIVRLHNYPQFAGSYENGWRNVEADLRIVPYHYSPTDAGIPIPALPNDVLAETIDTPEQLAARLSSINPRIEALNDENEVRNLQNAYGYYTDRKMWDDVTDLFTADGVLEVGGVGIYGGVKGVRRALDRVGGAGLKHGELNNHVQFDVAVTIAPGGTEAHARGIDLGMLGDSDHGQVAYWSLAVFDNRFLKGTDGTWRVREMRLFPVMKSDYYQGWGKSQIVDSPPAPEFAPDSKLPAADVKSGMAIPAFYDPNPATGKPVVYPAGMQVVGAGNLLRPSVVTPVLSVSRTADLQAALAESERKLAVSKANDGVENISSAFANWIDDFQWEKLGQTIADKGAREEPFSGFFVGPDRVTRAEVIQWGWPQPTPRGNIPIHLRIQPVIHVATDGRSANLTTRLFSIGASYTQPGAFSGAMYPNDQAILEDGVWKLWSVAIDEFYYQSAGYKGGWSKVKDPDSTVPANRRANILLSAYPPDIPVSALGERENGFDGGTGTPIEWPSIKPLWFSYKNPVSGRIPDHYWPDCASCVFAPESSMKNHGYLLPQ